MTKANTSTKATENNRTYECELCQDNEFIYDPKTNTATPCKCREVKRYKRILETSGISEAFLSKTFENFLTKGKPKVVADAKKLSQEYTKSFENIKTTENNSIALCGQVGSGKTHLATAIANELMKQGYGVLYMQYRDAITRLKQSLLDEENYQREINKYKRAAILFIDDLYKGKGKDDNIVYEIINHRYFTGLPMIITSEFSPTTWIDFDEGTGSRLIHRCRDRIIKFEGRELNHRL